MSGRPPNQESEVAVEVYAVRIKGLLGPELSEAFADLSVTHTGSQTCLTGAMDQAALHGVLDRISALGLELVDVRRVAPGADAADS
jgi:hypothetical protein